MKTKIFLICFQAIVILTAPALAAAEEAYKLSMLPRYFPEKIRSMIDPVAQYLSTEMGVRITPILTRSLELKAVNKGSKRCVPRNLT